MKVVRRSLISFAVVLGAALAACGQFTAGADLTVPIDNDGVGGGATTGVGGNIFTPTGGGGGGVDAGSDYVPVVNNSYSYLCGSMQDICLPGSTQTSKQCAMNLEPTDGDGGADAGTVSCTIVLDPNANNTATKNATLDECLPRGTFGDGDPCNTATDCAPGLGCVKSASAGVCRPYCCGDLEGCNDGSYCEPLSMAEASALIPVCVPASNCTLLDDSTCPKNETCTVVRMDGTTSCVYPGPHTRGEPCPCAAGYVCSQFNATCSKLCHLGSNDDCDGGGICTAGSTGFPDDVGICGGYAAN